jgi:hypothetical protein
MPDDTWPLIRCKFYVRSPADGGGGWHYDPVHLDNPDHDGGLWTDQPPAVGDLIHLWDPLRKHGGLHRVLARSWMHSSFGSFNWPYTERRPKVGPALDLIVEPTEGLFVAEVMRPEDAEDDHG